MLKFLAWADARLAEPSTWLAIAMFANAEGIHLDTASLQGWGVVVATALGVILKEGSSKPVLTVAADTLRVLATDVKPVTNPA